MVAIQHQMIGNWALATPVHKIYFCEFVYEKLQLELASYSYCYLKLTTTWMAQIVHL